MSKPIVAFLSSLKVIGYTVTLLWLFFQKKRVYTGAKLLFLYMYCSSFFFQGTLKGEILLSVAAISFFSWVEVTPFLTVYILDLFHCQD